MTEARQLRNLTGIGPAMLKDFEVLGIASVGELARRNPDKLYDELCARTGQRHDICVLDTFRAAVAQARDPNLPLEKRQWWYYSRQRKAAGK